MTVCVDRAVQNKIVVSLAALLKNLCFASFITVLPSVVFVHKYVFSYKLMWGHTCVLQNYKIVAHIAG
jgi:ABC-type polysaccharide transport system permease subunit